MSIVPPQTPTERALEIDAIRLRGRRNGALLIGLGSLAILGSWLLIPKGIIDAMNAAPAGGALDVAVGTVALVAGIVLVAVGIRTQKRAIDAAHDAQSVPGRANDHFEQVGAPNSTGQPPYNLTGLTIR
jgi:hypothetical protein